MKHTVLVRYRDVPYSEVEHCIPPDGQREFNEAVWNKCRGKPLRVYVPPVKTPDEARCGGVFYEVVKDDSIVVCSHYVEIGD